MTNKVNSDDAPAGFRAAPAHGGCWGCAFHAFSVAPDVDVGADLCWQSACLPFDRYDKQHVIFIKKE